MELLRPSMDTMIGIMAIQNWKAPVQLFNTRNGSAVLVQQIDVSFVKNQNQVSCQA